MTTARADGIYGADRSNCLPRSRGFAFPTCCSTNSGFQENLKIVVDLARDYVIIEMRRKTPCFSYGDIRCT